LAKVECRSFNRKVKRGVAQNDLGRNGGGGFNAFSEGRRRRKDARTRQKQWRRGQ